MKRNRVPCYASFALAVCLAIACLGFESLAQTPDNPDLGSVVSLKGTAPRIEWVGQIGNWAAWDIVVYGNLAYVAAGDRLRIIDVSDPTAPQEVGIWYSPGEATSVEVVFSSWQRTAYVAERGGVLRIVDVSFPCCPVEIGSYDTPGAAWSVAVSDSLVYVADGDEGLLILDVSDPAAPRKVGAYNGTNARGVAVVGGLAYIAAGMGGLGIVDVSDPVAPRAVGSCGTSSYAGDVVVCSGRAYLADQYYGLRIVDVSDPYAPREVGTCYTAGHAYGVDVSDNLAYVADWEGGLRLVDVSDPTVPMEVGDYDTSGNAAGVTVSGGLTYVADLGGGLTILRVAGHAQSAIALPLVLASRTRWLPAYDDGGREQWMGGRQGSFIAVRYPISPAARVVGVRYYLGGKELRPARFIVWDGAWRELYSQTVTAPVSEEGGWGEWPVPPEAMGPQSVVYVGYECLSDYSSKGPWSGWDTSQPDGATYAGPWPPTQRTDGDAMIRVRVQ